MRSLNRFVEAQDRRGAYDGALEELRHGRKRSHWMWFVFPQLAGLGTSEMARTYALDSLDEAKAYLDDPILLSRLLDATEAVLRLADQPIVDVLGPLDALKLRSSMTLFHLAAPEAPLFTEVLDRCFGGELDPLTCARLHVEPP